MKNNIKLIIFQIKEINKEITINLAKYMQISKAIIIIFEYLSKFQKTSSFFLLIFDFNKYSKF